MKADEIRRQLLGLHLPDFFTRLARQGVRCGSYVQGEAAGWEGTAPTASADVLFGEMKTSPSSEDAPKRSFLLWWLPLLQKVVEFLAPPRRVRHEQDDPAMEAEERA